MKVTECARTSFNHTQIKLKPLYWVTRENDQLKLINLKTADKARNQCVVMDLDLNLLLSQSLPKNFKDQGTDVSTGLRKTQPWIYLSRTLQIQSLLRPGEWIKSVQF